MTCERCGQTYPGDWCPVCAAREIVLELRFATAMAGASEPDPSPDHKRDWCE